MIKIFNLMSMGKVFIVLSLTGFLFPQAKAQECNNDFLGTKTLYTNNGTKYNAAPKGYQPVFINYVGRHGARHLTKEVTTTSAWSLLIKADSLNLITSQGKRLKQMVTALQKVEKGNTKNISGEGRDELYGIGKRTYSNYPRVFDSNPDLEVAITKEVRTDQSADAFLNGLKSKLKDSVSIKKYNDDTHLRFYDLSPAYKNFENGVDESNIKLTLNKREHLDQIANDFAGRFFEPALLDKIDSKAKEKFTSDIFGFAAIVYSLRAEIKQAGYEPGDLDFKSFFSCGELTRLDLLDNVDENLKKGPGTNIGGIQVRVAVPLLVDFITKADEFLKYKKANANIRFTHAEAIAPFAALLQIEGADQPATDASELSSVWKSSDVICLSANIQWVFYEKKGVNEYLVKVLRNEKEARISGLKNYSSYYKWADVRAFYVEKLNTLKVKLTDDMKTYLVELK